MRLILRATSLALLLAAGCSGGSGGANGTTGSDDSNNASDGDGSNADDGDRSNTSDNTASSTSAKPDAGRTNSGKLDGGSTGSDGPDGAKPDATLSGKVGDASLGSSMGDAAADGKSDAGTDAGTTPPLTAADAAVMPPTSVVHNTAPGFKNLAPPMGTALDPKKGTTVTPAAPTGWVWYEIQGAICRDGSATGFYVHYTDSDSLLLYLEGGGACQSPDFCTYNPKNVNQVLSGDGETLLGSVGGAIAGRQQPGKDGIFNLGKAENPFKTWNMIYVPYCTGDVHFGTKANATVPNVSGTQQFVGYRNMEKFMARIVPTFADKVKHVVLTGASAGGFGSTLNYSLVQDSFGDGALVTALDDSGPGLPNKDLPVCMQKRWKELFGYGDAFAADCTECKAADGGYSSDYPKFLQRKHPNFKMGLISSMEDEVIRAFFSASLNNCASFESASPVTASLLGSFPADDYREGLLTLRQSSEPAGNFASYYINGAQNKTFHQHIWRPRFYEAAQGSTTIAQWTSDFLAGKLTQVGP